MNKNIENSLPTEKPVQEPATESDTTTKVSTKVSEESQVIIHCTYNGTEGDRIRIWKSTFLYDNGSDHKSKLVLAENISLYPEWTLLKTRQQIRFTLIFTGLPRNCRSFDLVEKIPEPGAFIYEHIQRNVTDIYLLQMK